MNVLLWNAIDNSHSLLTSFTAGSASQAESCDWLNGVTREADARRISLSDFPSTRHCIALLYTSATTMVVKIRLARFGRRKAPFYNIVVAHARFVNLFIWIGECTDGCRTARNSKPIEVIGIPRIPAQYLCRHISANMDSVRDI